MLSTGYKEAVKNIRLRKHFTQKECAARAGVTAKTWSKYETGTLKITDGTLDGIRAGLICTRTELWHEAVQEQRLHFHGQKNEVRETAAQYGTSMAAGAVQGILALKVRALPAAEQRWFRIERNGLVTTLSSVLTMADHLVEKYIELANKVRTNGKDTEEDNAVEPE